MCSVNNGANLVYGLNLGLFILQTTFKTAETLILELNGQICTGALQTLLEVAYNNVYLLK